VFTLDDTDWNVVTYQQCFLFLETYLLVLLPLLLAMHNASADVPFLIIDNFATVYTR
jgi:hypothetical protein